MIKQQAAMAVTSFFCSSPISFVFLLRTHAQELSLILVNESQYLNSFNLDIFVPHQNFKK